MHLNRVTPFHRGRSGSKSAATFGKRFVLNAAMTSALVWLIFGGGKIQATIISNTTGLSNAANVYTFGSSTGAALFAPNTSITTQFSGITLSPNLYYDGNNGTGDGACQYANGNPNCLTNFTSSSGPLPQGQTYAFGMNIVSTFTITFVNVQTAAAFSLVTQDGDVDKVTALLNGTQVDSVTANTGRAGNYYGFQNESFNALTVTTTGSNLALINNLEFGTLPITPTPTPESGTAAIFSLGLVGMVAAFRKRNASLNL